jgi:hypothetical protein
MEKYEKDGSIGVLYSPGYGAGWSTWNSDDAEFLIFDKTLVEMAISKAKKTDVEEYLESKSVDAYTGGWENIKVEFVSKGSSFTVEEYDGKEFISYSPTKMFTA